MVSPIRVQIMWLVLTIAFTSDLSIVFAKSSVSENQIVQNINLRSHKDHIDAQPSRFRALLVNELWNVIRKSPPAEALDDCLAEANVKVDTLNCECRRFTCSARRFNYNTKRSRFLIARSCEDICCRKRILAKKQASTSSDNVVNNHRQCEIVNMTNNSQEVNNLGLKSIVQIYSVTGKRLLCLGSLVHPKAVLTTFDCVTARANDGLYIKMKETVDTYQNLYQLRNVTEVILPDNYMDRIEKLRFNMALLILDKEMDINNQIGISCLPRIQESMQSLGNRKCSITSLEYVNGRLMERNESIKIFDVERCRDIFSHQNRLQIFFPKQNICAGRVNGQTMSIKSNGASLVCIHQMNEKDGTTMYYYVLHGLLAWTNDAAQHDYIESPHLFTNVLDYRYWLEKKLKKYT